MTSRNRGLSGAVAVGGGYGTLGYGGRSAISLSHPQTQRERFINDKSEGDALSLEQLKKLMQYQCRHVGQSMMEPVLQPIWKTIAEFVPSWWSPNAIVFTGLIINGLTFTTLLLLSCSPSANEEAPKPAYYLCSLGILLLQFCHATGERQAQKIGDQSPIRELFCYGCEAISNAFVVLGVCTATKLGSHPKIMFIQFFSMLFFFYSAHWQTYCSGIINFQYFDIMEAQFSAAILLLFTALLGPGVWDAEMFMGCPLKMFPVFISLLVGYISCLNRLSIIIIQGGVGKNGSTVADTSVLSPLVPVVILVLFGYWLCSHPQSSVLQRHIFLLLAFLGISLVKLSCKIVISHMTRTEMALLDFTLAFPLLSVIFQHFNLFSDENTLWICFIISFGDFILFCKNIWKDVFNYLKLPCFSIQILNSDAQVQSHHSFVSS